MASKINGTNIILYYYDPITNTGIPFGSATSCSFSASVDQTEITASDSGGFKEFKNGQSSWQVNCDGFMSLTTNYNYAFLAQLIIDKTPITIKFQIDNDNGTGSGTLGYTVFNGNANLTSLSLSGPVEGTSTYSATLQGTGTYSITGTQVEPSGVIVVGSNVVMFDYTAAGGETSITWSPAIGLSCVTVTRGGIEVRSIGTSGAPTGENVVFNSSTGTLTFASGRALESDEFVRALFK